MNLRELTLAVSS